ncbi:hypothetical protein SAPIO_CDS7259 [Scedosporium apiospermum]|uniref:Protein kinase domain-containing protein n=1 Tax=Pseudallescheria apiosperma TaxID=563466 RepID=A0A084G1G7_PSEDA|nr:uncharacterized protein SAPIO_CDS7259 [Scedosporium apiospermum]KEZ41179.1 hypothetical protein SAPIO_CDS7259 [Scedosporium apiospermum]
MVKLEDPEILERDVRDEYDHPLPQKVLDERTIYLSRNNYGRLLRPTGIVQITDFGLSVRGDVPHSGCIQAELYRAPEVVLDAGYTYSADIWSLGVMLWDLLQGKKLFDLVDPTTGEYDDQRHLAQITSLLGKAPDDLLRQGQRTSMFYESDGKLKDPSLVSPGFSFEGTIDVIDGEEKRMFIEFVKRMLRWSPKERQTAKELLNDPWLHDGFSQ